VVTLLLRRGWTARHSGLFGPVHDPRGREAWSWTQLTVPTPPERTPCMRTTDDAAAASGRSQVGFWALLPSPVASEHGAHSDVPLHDAPQMHHMRKDRTGESMYLHDGFRELDRQECLALLVRTPVGRIVHTRHALPAVLPVNFGLDTDSAVVLRTSAESELARAIDGVVVAFEADDVDAVAQSGWSVVVTGRAMVVTDSGEQRRLGRTGPRSWIASPDDVFIRIEADLVTGRRLAVGRSVVGLGPTS